MTNEIQLTTETKTKKLKPIPIIVTVLILALAALCTYQFLEMQKLRNPNHVADQAKQDAANLKEKVSHLMQLPEEEATIATVEDASKLTNQEFFSSTKDGDKVLIFTQAKKAIIYRESENRIINSGPIILNSPE